jgi:hypothetical protein
MATVTLYRIVSTIALDAIVASDSTVASLIPLAALLTSSPVMWREEHLFNFCVLQRAMLSGSLVTTAWRVLRLRMEEKASRYGG